MALDPIHIGDTDTFTFDLTAYFPVGIDPTTVMLSSNPIGFTFGAPSSAGSLVTVNVTAPTTTGAYNLLCSASDGSPRRLTAEGRILVLL